ncbi:hypothetical protein O1611_g5110 [Lasiodiplodia mahajangana]|uniref:Uncharacterized protein n=1 Tax=Lasiodiplodia mahajangana TaxID=1108764 RepID=A0ACC2JM06_9PEZI|nr:hypothetical protein O1611_g5110 [Lasiodiplodia mahajangana]
MEPFKLSLSNGGTVAGILSLPPRSTSPLEYRPLVVGLHGSTYDCHYFNADPKHTASISSTGFGIPFISIDRPCYGGTSSFLPIPEGSSFPQETGSWLHHYILPALWSKFGVPNGCNCIVLLCHSLGAISGIVTAAMHAQDEKPQYPLGGIIISGIGDEQHPYMKENPISEPNNPPHHHRIPIPHKDAMMFQPETFHPDILQHSERLDSPAPFAEFEGLTNHWLPSWADQWASHVKAPVMFALAERDCFFVVTEECVRRCASAFVNSVRVDSSLVKNAPHCLELSYWSQGWYARCFGFAVECSASFALSNR